MADQKALQLMEQATKKASGGSGFFSSLFSDPSRRQEEAAELFKEAAIQFKIAKNHKMSGEAYLKAAELYNSIKVETIQSFTQELINTNL